MNKMKKIKISFSIFLLSIAMMAHANAGDIQGKVSTEANKTKYKANTIVFVEKVDGNFKPPAKNPEMNQKNLMFIPRVLPVVVGTTVDFLNSDDVLHNVFTPDGCAGKFNLGSWKKGEVRTHKYDKVGCNSVLLCNVHPDMEAYIIVLQNPYFCVTDKDGNFTIKNVPVGKYTIKVWNEKLKADSQEVIVKASGKVELNFNLKK